MIEKMKCETPSMRPSIDEAIALWNTQKEEVATKHHWRLSPKAEQEVERFINDTVAAAWRGISGFKKKYVK